MSYEFKKLSEVTALEEMKEGLNVLVEDGGEIVKVAADKVGGDRVIFDITSCSDFDGGDCSGVTCNKSYEEAANALRNFSDCALVYDDLATEGANGTFQKIIPRHVNVYSDGICVVWYAFMQWGIGEYTLTFSPDGTFETSYSEIGFGSTPV